MAVLPSTQPDEFRRAVHHHVQRQVHGASNEMDVDMTAWLGACLQSFCFVAWSVSPAFRLSP
jgi:hypothetical protein